MEVFICGLSRLHQTTNSPMLAHRLALCEEMSYVKGSRTQMPCSEHSADVYVCVDRARNDGASADVQTAMVRYREGVST